MVLVCFYWQVEGFGGHYSGHSVDFNGQAWVMASGRPDRFLRYL